MNRMQIASSCIEIGKNFDARYWEMYLTTFFIREGYKVSCPKPGPDVGIEFCGRRIWFEATSPSRGEDGKPDRVPEIQPVRLGDDPVVGAGYKFRDKIAKVSGDPVCLLEFFSKMIRKV